MPRISGWTKLENKKDYEVWMADKTRRKGYNKFSVIVKREMGRWVSFVDAQDAGVEVLARGKTKQNVKPKAMKYMRTNFNKQTTKRKTSTRPRKPTVYWITYRDRGADIRTVRPTKKEADAHANHLKKTGRKRIKVMNEKPKGPSIYVDKRFNSYDKKGMERHNRWGEKVRKHKIKL